MRSVLYAGFILVTSLVFAPVVRAQGTTETRHDATVTSVDSSSNLVELRDPMGASKSYPLTADVRIQGENGALNINDLRVGDHVSVVENPKGEISQILITSPSKQR